MGGRLAEQFDADLKAANARATSTGSLVDPFAGLDLKGGSTQATPEVAPPSTSGRLTAMLDADLASQAPATATAPAQPNTGRAGNAGWVDPFAGLDLDGGTQAAPAGMSGGQQGGGSALDNFGSALLHHLGSALHGTAQFVEHGIAKGADLIDQTPQGLTSVVTGQRTRAPWNQAFQNTVAADDAALAKREADYQANVPNNAASYAGAAAGEVAPFLIGGVGSGLRTVGNAAGNLATRGMATLEPYVPAVLSRWLPRVASGAAQGGAIAATQPVTTSGDYWQSKGSQLQTGATLGGAMPLAGAVASGARNAVGGVLSQVLGASTGAGADAVRTAFRSGLQNDAAFLANMRGNAQMEDVLDQARQGLAQMRADRAAAYRSGMLDISKDKSVLDFAPIQDAVDKVQALGSYKGVQINKNAAGTVQDLANTVKQWGSLDPAEYHTPEGWMH